MKPLQYPDNLHLRAAHGWWELGNHLEANEELEKISPKLRDHPGVLELRLAIYSKEKRWEDCVDIARSVVKLSPKNSFGWIQQSYALRRAKGGGLEAALNALSPAAKKFPKEWLIPYNLACYCSMLGRLEEAQVWFKKSMAVDEKAVQQIALTDPDLQPLWDSMGGTVWKTSGKHIFPIP